MRMGNVIEDSFLNKMMMEAAKGTTHAHPAIWRPNKEKPPSDAMKVEITTIQTMNGAYIFLNFITSKFMNGIFRLLPDSREKFSCADDTLDNVQFLTAN